MRSLSVLALSCVLAISLSAQTASHSGTEPKTIKASGCVRAGVEPGCMVLENFQGKRVYSPFFKTGTKPDLNIAVAITGETHEGPTT